MHTKKQTWSERIKKRNKLGFSLVELIVVVAIMAIFTAVLAPSLLSYVERSRAQKDNSAMGEVTNAIMLALADQDVYDEVLCYTAANNKSCYVDGLATYDENHASYTPTKKNGDTVVQYMFGDDARQQDEVPFTPAGVMRGVTITFVPEKSTNKSVFVLYNAVINKLGAEGFIYGSMPASETNEAGELLLGGMSSFDSAHHSLYNRLRSTVGNTIELTSQTYRNSEYTVFIRMGTTGGNQADAQDAIVVYGQWSGTNLSYGATSGSGAAPEAPTENPNGPTEGPIEPIVTLAPGLYQTGAIDKYKAEGAEAVESMLKTSWAELLATNVVAVENGVVYAVPSGPAPKIAVGNDGPLTGDLVLPNDGSITKLGDAYWDDEAFYDEEYDEYYGGYVGHVAFAECYSLTGIIIPDSVTDICEGAFYGCTSLKNITIPESVTLIDSYAFEACESLQSLIIEGENTTFGEDGIIWDCYQLKHITVGDKVFKLVTKDDLDVGDLCFTWLGIDESGSYQLGFEIYLDDQYDFNGWYVNNELISTDYYFGILAAESTTIVADASVSRAGLYDANDNLVASWNDLVNKYGMNVQQDYTSSNYKTNTHSPYYVLTKNSSLSAGVKLVLPNTITTIGDYAFYDCDNLADITLSNSVTIIGNSAFSNCDSLTSVIIPDSVTTIGDSAFYGCYDLTSAVIGDSVTTIGNSAFSYCNSLTSVTIGDRVATIGNSAFGHCYKLTSVTIGNNVTTIGDYAFYACAIPNVTIPDNVTSIGEHAFAACKALTSMTIPNNVTSIGEWAFSNCDNIANVTIGDNVTSIGYGAFYNCDGLTSVTIPDSVTNIGGQAFYDCTNLTSVTIPDSVTTIGNHAFYLCDKLTIVTFDNTNGWSAGSTTLSSTDLSNKTTAATYLRSTHSDKIWTRTP